MQSLSRVLLGVGAILLVVAVVAKLINSPIFGSKPMAITSIADTCLLLAIGLLLADQKK